MPSNLAFVKHRLQLRLNGSVDVSGGSDVVVHWIEIAGGELDALTGARVGGVETPVSGVLRALGYETPAATVLRKFAEIKAGDLILEVDPAGLVALQPHQPLSGVVSLDAISKKGVRFEWCGQLYTQAEVGEELAATWSVVVANQRLYRTLLLRRAT